MIRIRIYPLFFMGVCLMFACSCSKNIEVDNVFGGTDLHFPPVVTTAETTNITESTAISGGDIQSAGSTAITARGICWSDTTNFPTTSDTHIADASGAQNFRIMMSGLKSNTFYVVRAYATNSIGTGYGSGMSFTTK